MLDREQKSIQSMSDFEQKVINKQRTVFSSTMSPDQVLRSNEMTIRLKEIKSDKGLYCYKPRPVPIGMRQQAKKLIETFEETGIIQRVIEPTQTCAPAAFVKKP